MNDAVGRPYPRRLRLDPHVLEQILLLLPPDGRDAFLHFIAPIIDECNASIEAGGGGGFSVQVAEGDPRLQALLKRLLTVEDEFGPGAPT